MIRMRDGRSDSSEHVEGSGPVNPYHVLQVRRDATPSEIRQAYRRLALWHHPGRSHESLDERRRRLQMFEIVSACYETLMSKECKHQLDALIKVDEKRSLTAGLPTGEMFVGGKRLVGHSGSSRSLLTMAEDDELGTLDTPSLSRVSSQSTISEPHHDHLMIMTCAQTVDDGNLSKLMNVSTSGSEDAAEVHFTQNDTNRLFGGPLSLLYRARKWKPFTDPFVVFEMVFGSRLFHVNLEALGRLPTWMPLPPSRSAAWVGFSKKQSDGSTIFVTSRVLHDRTLTRTETVYVDPKTRHSQTVVTITAEDLEPPAEEPEPQSDCLMCHRSRIKGDLEEDAETHATACANLYILYNDFVQHCTIPINPEIITLNGDLFQWFGFQNSDSQLSSEPNSTVKDTNGCLFCCELA